MAIAMANTASYPAGDMAGGKELVICPVVSKQYSELLCRFVTQPSYIIEPLEECAFTARFYAEDISYLRLGSFKSLAIPMVCFCNSPRGRLNSHPTLYGDYGIAMTKEWGVRAGLQPVQYVNPYSHAVEDFRRVFEKALNDCRSDDSGYNKLKDYLITQLLFMKPIDSAEEEQCFLDDCEWRFVPEDLEKMPVIAPNISRYECRDYNAALKRLTCGRLRFEYGDVAGLRAKSADSLNQLIQMVKQSSIPVEHKRRLIEEAKLAKDEED